MIDRDSANTQDVPIDARASVPTAAGLLAAIAANVPQRQAVVPISAALVPAGDLFGHAAARPAPRKRTAATAPNTRPAAPRVRDWGPVAETAITTRQFTLIPNPPLMPSATAKRCRPRCVSGAAGCWAAARRRFDNRGERFDPSHPVSCRRSGSGRREEVDGLGLPSFTGAHRKPTSPIASIFRSTLRLELCFLTG